ncbi:MAG: MotA/TolQ/ExbB proton channel family protein [Candidatus Omnitrophica bacterium]|nr:MotA/TolQ/ExbB proton channel family protein [Candidatus Omnitrophota bacterium]
MENIWITSWKHFGWVGKTILTILFMMSIYSWSIMINKFLLFKRVKKANKKFLDVFYNGKIINVPDSPWSRILNKTLKEKTKREILEENLYNFIKRLANEEMLSLSSKLDFLLSVSAVAPFMGLLGTVWGILMAFHNIGITGTSSISIIASGISEALIVTFAGLVVAIPAALGYNYFDGELRKIKMQGEEVLNAIYAEMNK